jgi:hypothetical protein
MVMELQAAAYHPEFIGVLMQVHGKVLLLHPVQVLMIL